jgi:signal transduction histidine kinase/ligand-binding sensor domain-containing protein
VTVGNIFASPILRPQKGLFVVIFCLACSPASGLDRDRTIKQLYHTAWRASDGAPSQISALAQTTDGYLWIGSARGLFRFDGVTFQQYEPPPGTTLPAYNIYSLLATPDGALWIAFRPSGLGVLKDGALTIFAADELPSSEMHCLARDLDGRIWAGANTGLMLRDGSRWISVGQDWNLRPDFIRSLFVDRDGTLWLSTPDSIAFLRRGSRSFDYTGIHLTEVDVPGFAQGKDGRVWFVDSFRGLRSIALTGYGVSREQTTLRTFSPLQAIFDRDGSLWITDQLLGMFRVRNPESLEGAVISSQDPRLEHFREADGLSADVANNLLEDREGSIWISTGKGLDRFRRRDLVAVSLPSDYQKYTLLAGGDGQVWAGNTSANPILLIHGEGQSREWKGRRQISSVYKDADGDVWWGCADGLWRQRDQHFDFYHQPDFIPHDWIYEIIRCDDGGGLWVDVGDSGFVHFKNGIWTNRKPSGLLARGPSATFHDQSGRIWLGYTENRVHLMDHGQVTTYSQADGIDVGRIRVIRGRAGHIWVGGELGLMMFVDGHFQRVKMAGSEQLGTVTGIVETADSGLWLNEMRGIVHIDPDQLLRLASDPSHAVDYRRFTFLDGLPGSPQMNFTNATAIEASDGRLWFATDNGLVWIDPGQMIKNDLAPPVAIQSATSEKGRRLSGNEVDFAAGTHGIEIDYTALSLSIPERVLFRYRLEGLDSQWQEAGNRRKAFYTNLKPGHYRFHVIACNNDGVWNEQGATLSVNIAPAFYQTAWFIVLCLMAVVPLVWLAYTWRIHRMMARMDLQFQERLAERTRIAQELHDTLLQGFISASIQLHVVANSMPPDSTAKPKLIQVLELTRSVIQEGRDAVGGLRSPHAGLDRLEKAFMRVGEELGVKSSVDFRVIVEGKLRALQPLISDEVYRIGREALVNSFRHSKATRIEVAMEYAERHFRMLVRDNGSGIDAQVLVSGREGHWGLSGMRERAQKIGGNLRVWSRAGTGTEIELQIPGYVAFASTTSTRLVDRLLGLLWRR